jgi:anthranilate/para-aminobenzoate synthase component I
MGWHPLDRRGDASILLPELFFALSDSIVSARPMKGTARRGIDAAQDAAAKLRLHADPKERAENLMIVDLLRNDMSRVSQPGSVRVEELFGIETYPTLHQMTSSITARLQPGLDAIDVIERLFPCGSITGAPRSAPWRSSPSRSNATGAVTPARWATSPRMAARHSTC